MTRKTWWQHGYVEYARSKGCTCDLCEEGFERMRMRRRSLPAAPLVAQLASIRGQYGDSPQERAIHRGLLSEYMADELACGIGLHPSAIWPEWFGEDT